MSSSITRRRFHGNALGLTALAIAALRPGRSATAQVPAEVRGRFRLATTDGKAFTEADLLGRPSLVVFGFMSCPDVCPTTLMNLALLMKALGPKADALRVAFISVDPERDDPASLGKFVTSFDPRIIGLTGSPEAVRAAVVSYHALAEKIPQGDSYTMMHSTGLYLADKTGLVRDLLEPTDTTEALVARITPWL